MKNLTDIVLDMKRDFFSLWLDGKLIILGFSVGGVLSFMQTYLFSDLKYLIWLLVVVILDSLAKLYSLWFVEIVKPSFKIFIDKFLNKSFKYTIYLIASYALVNFEVDGKKMEFLQVFNVILYGILIVKEVLSIMHSLQMKLPKQITDIINSKFEIENEEKK